MPNTQPYTEEEFAKHFPNEDKDIKEMLGLGYVPKLFRTAIAVSPSLAFTIMEYDYNYMYRKIIPGSERNDFCCSCKCP